MSEAGELRPSTRSVSDAGELRILSLLPSATELVCALGLRDALVGRSHECDFPSGVETLPVCTRVRFDDGSSREIDDRVRDLLARGLSVYEVDPETLRELAPTHIVTQDQCAACAATPKDLESALASWLDGEPPQIVSQHPASLGEVWADVLRTAEILGAGGRGRALTVEMANRTSEVGERTGALSGSDRPGVLCLEWLDPLMSAGNWMPELVTLAGGRPLLANAGFHSPFIEWDAVREADPEVLVLIPCGFDIARTRSELAPLRAQPGFETLQAVRDGRVVVADGNALFNRPGPRLVDSLEVLAETVHPKIFGRRHEGDTWEPL